MKPGYYWVKAYTGGEPQISDWIPGLYCSDAGFPYPLYPWQIIGTDDRLSQDGIVEIGPRIEPPLEPPSNEGEPTKMTIRERAEQYATSIYVRVKRDGVWMTIPLSECSTVEREYYIAMWEETKIIQTNGSTCSH